jgi:medium-chain acyl-[acyl-carrier-protein] hydrolase
MTGSALSPPTVLCPQRNPQAGLRLFCFPYAGGGASIYSKWAASLPESVELHCVQLPGRETRIFEPAYRQLAPLIEALAPVLAPQLDRPFAVFGHSMGALIGFELCRHLRRQGQPMPIGLFVSGRQAPHRAESDPPIHALRALNGTPHEVLANAELMEMALPGLRADFELCETYVHTPEPPLNLPILAFGGLFDRDVSREDVDAWREHTTGRFSLSMLPGDHFFIESARPQLLQRLVQELVRLRPEAGR